MNEELEYVGFWLRVWAALIDTLLVLLMTLPLVALFYGWDLDKLASSSGERPLDLIINWVLPAIAVLLFWHYRQATPGKMVIGARIVDAGTGAKPSTGQNIGRYLGYFVSIVPFCLGLLWVGWDARKQGWHDKLAGTVVVRNRRRGTESVRFTTERTDPH
ncbi:RDD family protein [Rivibacter subsaxonicus]|uniref:Putative RDD family membrane protein YckC n=1 Tax=Rivibacter subsaxonicus TaxID=457575 RepID=A0A4Q7VNG9_9BURK|nr:RDD family protein [Rivibacter subsaxonicus]RZT97916.1 putative RDD family membrane protein YckC [Rivibacter subsaxonicus]